MLFRPRKRSGFPKTTENCVSPFAARGPVEVVSLTLCGLKNRSPATRSSRAAKTMRTYTIRVLPCRIYAPCAHV